MAFDLFKKKKDVVDFRPKDADMPIPTKMKDRLLAGRSSSPTPTAIITQPGTSSSSSSSSSGGFFSFFGGGTDSSSGSSSESSNSSSSSTTDFWGNSTSSPTNSSSSSNNTEKLESSLNDVIYRLSRMTDRLELVEKKIERLERKMGVGSDSSY